MANTVLAKMAVVIDAQTAAFNKSLKDTNSRLDSFTGGLKNIAGVLGVTFAVKQVAGFALEVSKLAGEADGVEAAFRKLPNSTQLMLDLKDATGGTVSELDLMKRSVQAANFGISLKALPDLLEFAAVRAQQTGQSVDYLVDSIVTGIGRKSPLILDNLGISAVALKNELGGVSVAAADVGQVAEAVGRIASKGLEQMGGLAENNATKMQRLNAVWDDFQVAIGRALNGTGLLGTSLNAIIVSLRKIKEFSDFLNSDPVFNDYNKQLEEAVLNFQNLNKEQQTVAINQLAQDVQKAKNQFEELNEILVEYNKNKDNVNGNPFADAQQSAGENPLTKATEAIKELGFSGQEAIDIIRGINIELELEQKGYESLNAQLKRYLEIYNDIGSESGAIGIVKSLKDEIKSLGDQIDDSTSLSGIRDLQKQLEITQSRLNGILNPPETPDIKLGVQLERPVEDVIKEIQTSLDNSIISVDIQLDFEAEEVFTSDEEQAIVDRVHRVQEAFRALGDFLKDSIANGIADFAYALGEAAGGSEDFGKKMLQSITGFAKQFGALLISAGLAKIAFENLAVSGYGAVIAGAALIAAAGAVNAHLSKSSSAASGGGGSSPSRRASSSSSSSFSSSAQDTRIGVDSVVLRGQDLYLSFQAYQAGNKYTKSNG